MGRTPPIVAIVGNSGAGKTTLVERVVATLSLQGHKVGTIKHSCHPHPMDMPGKDSWRHKRAGARKSVFAGPASMQLVMDTPAECEPEDIAASYMQDMDIVIVEGFKQARLDKIEVVRAGISDSPSLSPSEGLIAIATDMRLQDQMVPLLNLNDPEEVASFLTRHLSIRACKL